MMRSSLTAFITTEDENGEREPTRRQDAFRRKATDVAKPGGKDMSLVTVSSVVATNKSKSRSGASTRNRVIKYATSHSVLSYVLFGLLFHVIVSQISAPHGRGVVNVHRRREEENLLPRYANSFIPSSLPREPNITLLTTGFQGYSNARQKELHLVAFRNTNLGFKQYHRLCEPQCTPIYSRSTSVSFRNVKDGVTYRDLFQEANKFVGSVVVIANADIYFDHTIYCAGFIDKDAVLALSRHPSPDCISSARGASGREPVDFCGGYHPIYAASHDGFVFVPPVPQQVIDGLEGLRVNELGAENVVIHLMQNAGRNVVNPCERIHLFHQHCGNERASSAKKRISDPKWRRLFGSTTEWGYGGSSWIHKGLRSRYGNVDCMALGLVMEKKKGLH